MALKRPDVEETIERLPIYLEGRPEVRFAYLFESWARGRVKPLSDIDVAIYLDEESTGGGPALRIQG